MPQPSVEHIAFILHKCREGSFRVCASRMYAFMQKSALDAHKLLGNNLVSTLADAGSMLDADKVFERLAHRNQQSWNALISGNIRHRKPELAFMLYLKMQDDDSVHPTVHTFLALLQVCAKTKDLERGLGLHAEILRIDLLKREPFVGSTLVVMYAECGSLAKSQEVFDQLFVHDVVSWNALITGYARHDHGEEALHCFEQMRLDGVPPDVVTFVCILKACGTIGIADKGQKLHAEIEKKGLFDGNLFVGNTLVDMYAKCGLLANARLVFDKVQSRDVISWNALIAGYGEHGHGKEALNLFDQMQHEGVSPDGVTFVCSLKACGSIGAAEKGQEIHAEVARRGLVKRESVGNTLVDMYAKCGLLAKAQEVFDDLPVHNVVSWNAIIAGYSEFGYGEDALRCFEQMQLDGISPDAATSICSLKACGSLGAIHKGLEIHAEIDRKGFLKSDYSIGGALVDMYARCGLLVKAQEIFDSLPIRDNVSWTALIAGYAANGYGDTALKYFEQMELENVVPDAITFVCSLKACGGIGASDKGLELHAKIEREGFLESDLVVSNCLIDMYGRSGLLARAQKVFDKLLFRDVVSWNALIAGYVEQGLGQRAINSFEQMQLSGFSPDSVTYVSSLKACGSVGAINKGEQIHAEIERKGLLERDAVGGNTLVLGNTLVNMYAKCGALAKAQEVFDRLLIRDVVSWNALLAGFVQLGDSGVHVLNKMLGQGIKPDAETFTSILNGCSRTGLFINGQTYFEALSKDYGIVPTLAHLTCLVDLLCHAGQLDKAEALIKKSPFSPDLVMWYTVLGACIKCGSVELGRKIFKHAVLLDQKHAASYVLLTSICGGVLMQEGWNLVESKRAKRPGPCSGTDTDQIMHPSLVRDQSESDDAEPEFSAGFSSRDWCIPVCATGIF